MKARFCTSHWQRLAHDSRDLDPGFARHLRDAARPRQIAFQRLMGLCDGNPVGIECKSETRDAWAFVLPDVVGESPYRVQTFDLDGFFGHSCYNSLQEATEAMIGDGYRLPDPGALDRCAATLRWAIGVKRSEIRLLFHLGKVGWTEMLERMDQVILDMQGAAA